MSRNVANRVPAASRAKAQAAPQSKHSAAVTEVTVSSPKKRPVKASQAESNASLAAPSSLRATSKSNASRAAAATEAQADSEDDIFESKIVKSTSKKAEAAAVKFSSASALLASDHAEADDDDDCTVYLHFFSSSFSCLMQGTRPISLSSCTRCRRARPPPVASGMKLRNTLENLQPLAAIASSANSPLLRRLSPSDNADAPPRRLWTWHDPARSSIASSSALMSKI